LQAIPIRGLHGDYHDDCSGIVVRRGTEAAHPDGPPSAEIQAAALMGIDVGRVQVLTFALGIGILAIAAALLLPGTPIQPTQGLRYTVITLLVVVLGGMTNFVGIMLEVSSSASPRHSEPSICRIRWGR
jgi:hypothetical protein